MEASEGDFDFSEFSSQLNKNFQQNAINLKELCITRSVMKPADYFKSLEQLMQEEASQVTPTKTKSTVAEYAELFKLLDTYPSNLQRLPKKRELQRTNSSILKGNEITQDQTTLNTSNVSLTLNNTRPEDARRAAEVYSDFRKFQQKLRQISEETAALEKAQSAYKATIAQLQSFAQQLETLVPSERDFPDAFTAEEEASLAAIAENLKQLNSVQANSLSKVANTNETATARLEVLVEVLTYTLEQISCYNNTLFYM